MHGTLSYSSREIIYQYKLVSAECGMELIYENFINQSYNENEKRNSISAVWAVILCVMMGLTACQDYSIDSQPAGAPQVQCDALEQYNVESTGVDNIVLT